MPGRPAAARRRRDATAHRETRERDPPAHVAWTDYRRVSKTRMLQIIAAQPAYHSSADVSFGSCGIVSPVCGLPLRVRSVRSHTHWMLRPTMQSLHTRDAGQAFACARARPARLPTRAHQLSSPWMTSSVMRLAAVDSRRPLRPSRVWHELQLQLQCGTACCSQCGTLLDS